MTVNSITNHQNNLVDLITVCKLLNIMIELARAKRTDAAHSGPKTIKKSGAWIGAQLTILCSINRKLRSGDYKEIGVRFLCSV